MHHTLLIVDDHPIVRFGIAQLLSHHPDLRCGLQAGDAVQALEMLRHESVDLLITNLTMPGLSGLELTRLAVSGHPGLPVLALSAHDEAAWGERAWAAGASGYVHKQAPVEELVEAVRCLLQGGRWFGPAVGRSPRQVRPRAGPLAQVGEREYEVLQMLAQGMSSAEMAQRVHRSLKSIELYRAALRRKLGVRSVAELTRLAIEHCAD